MDYATSSVTQKGQVTIPVKLRKKFNIALNSRVRISEGPNYEKVEPINSVESLAGSLYQPGQKPLSINDLRKIRESGLLFKGEAK